MAVITRESVGRFAMGSPHNFLTIDFKSWAYPDIEEFRRLSSEQRKRLDNGFVLESGDQILRVLRYYNES